MAVEEPPAASRGQAVTTHPPDCGRFMQTKRIFCRTPSITAIALSKSTPLYAASIVPVGVDHPRPAISALLGEGRHNAPTLVLHASSERVRGLEYAEANGQAYLASARLIARHFAAIHGTPSPRGE